VSWSATASASAFADATACYGRAEAALLARRHELEHESGLSESRRALRLARVDRQTASARRAAATSAFNAAAGHANAGRPDLAGPFLARAARHQDFHARAEALLKKIEGSTPAPR
jgi:hypothetical protein